MTGFFTRLFSRRVRMLEEVIRYKDEEYRKLEVKDRMSAAMYATASAERNGYKKLTLNLTNQLAQEARISGGLRNELFLANGGRLRRQAVKKFTQWLASEYGLFLKDGQLYYMDETMTVRITKLKK